MKGIKFLTFYTTIFLLFVKAKRTKFAPIGHLVKFQTMYICGKKHKKFT